MQVRRAGDQRHLARLGDAEADHPDEGVGAALHHRRAGFEARMLRGFRGQSVDHVAGAHDVLRPFPGEFRAKTPPPRLQWFRRQVSQRQWLQGEQ